MRNALKAGLAVGVVATVATAGFAMQVDANDGYRHHGQHDRHHYRHHRFLGHDYSRLMERFDADDNDELTQDELDAARKDLLAKHDADKNGELSLDEFKALWLEFMHRRMVRGFQQLDEDGSASVTVDEFIKPFSKAVSHMDRNGDGKLNSDDRRRSEHRRRHRDDTDED